MDATAELGRNPISKHQIQPEYGVEQADTGRDILTFPVQLTSSRIGNLARLIHTLLYVMTILVLCGFERDWHLIGLSSPERLVVAGVV